MKEEEEKECRLGGKYEEISNIFLKTEKNTAKIKSNKTINREFTG